MHPRTFLIIFVATVVLSLAGWWLQPISPGLTNDLRIPPDGVRTLGQILWLDARSVTEPRFPDSIRVSQSDWEESLDRILMVWDPDIPTIVVCESSACDESLRIARRLRLELGVDSIYALDGGWEALDHLHYP